MRTTDRRSFAFCLLPALALAAVGLSGCRNAAWNNRSTVVPPPGGTIGGSGQYYSAPSGAIPLGAAANYGNAFESRSNVSLAPLGSANANSAIVNSPTQFGAAGQNTYDVASRVPADNQPIRVLDGTSRTADNSPILRGMPVNDGTNVSSWRSGINTSSATNYPANSGVSNAFSGIRGGTALQGTTSSQGYSGLDGQWRSRSSYEATERR